MSKTRADILIIGGGMAGLSAGYFLAADANVILLEREDALGYHTTGRSAATFVETYGNAVIRALTKGSRGFLESPPSGFCETPILSARGALYIAHQAQVDRLCAVHDEVSALGANVYRLDSHQTREIVPALRPSYVAAGLYEPDCMDVDVDTLLQGFARGFRAQDGRIIRNADVQGAHRVEATGQWALATTVGVFEAPVVVNAAGAWAEVVGSYFGAQTIGLVPKRRTAFLFEHAHDDPRDWPMTIDVEEGFYFKPDAGRLFGSPADESPMPPCDIQPEDLDIAVAVDRIQTASTLEVKRIEHRWAGLRSFVGDKTPVVGFDVSAPGFFWLAGQGGYGIQTSVAMGRVASSLVAGNGIPEDLAVRACALSPQRFAIG
ncbi:MAG: FAD-binding oxidoreductase [Gammaproteobacteria bacterium]|nr:FAD-binding oxidoreductase [Gammaproteobacteria bacterium]